MVYKLSKPRDRRSTYFSEDAFHQQFGRSTTHCRDIILRWLTHFDGLSNTENPRRQMENGLLTERAIEMFNATRKNGSR